MDATSRWKFLLPLAVASVLCAVGNANGANEQLPVLVVRGTTYTNVVVTDKTATVLFFRHSRGIATAKAGDLDAEAQVRFGFVVPKEAPLTNPLPGTQPRINPPSRETLEAIPSEPADPNAELPKAETETDGDEWARCFNLSPKGELACEVIGAVLLLMMIGLYVPFCQSCRNLCRRAGAPSHVLVWLPDLKRLALFKAAGVPWMWYFLGRSIPLVGPVAWIVCCRRLCDIFHQSRWWTLLMFIPVLGWPVFMYFSHLSRAEDDEPAVRGMILSPSG